MMRYDLERENNNQHDNPKTDYGNYIETSIEPFDSEITAEMSTEIEVEMAETIYDMRREFKRQNKKLRKLYSSKEPKEYKTVNSARGRHLPKRRALA